MNFAAIMKICNFKIDQISPFKDISGYTAIQIRKVIGLLGNLISAIIAMIIIILLVQLLYIAVKKNTKMANLIKNLKDKLLWSSILRSLMLGYFLQTYTNLDRSG